MVYDLHLRRCNHRNKQNKNIDLTQITYDRETIKRLENLIRSRIKCELPPHGYPSMCAQMNESSTKQN